MMNPIQGCMLPFSLSPFYLSIQLREGEEKKDNWDWSWNIRHPAAIQVPCTVPSPHTYFFALGSWSALLSIAHLCRGKGRAENRATGTPSQLWRRLQQFETFQWEQNRGVYVSWLKHLLYERFSVCFTQKHFSC